MRVMLGLMLEKAKFCVSAFWLQKSVDVRFVCLRANTRLPLTVECAADGAIREAARVDASTGSCGSRAG